MTSLTLEEQKLTLNKLLPDDVNLDDVIFLVSYPKSGSTWLRFLIGNYLTENKCDFTNHRQIMPSIYGEDSLIKNSKTRPLFIKSHKSYTPIYKKVVYIVRHGMDVAVSYYYYSLKFKLISENTTFDDFLLYFNGGFTDDFNVSIDLWSNHVKGWLNHHPENLLLVKYEDLQKNTHNTLKNILVFAGIKPNEKAIISAVLASSFEKMQSSELEQYSYNPVFLNSDHSIKFIRKGLIGESEEYFKTDKSINEFLSVHGSGLIRAGYLSNNQKTQSQYGKNMMSKIQKCWCGSTHLNYFSPEYSICQECNTLISQCGLSNEQIVVKDDQEDFYGKEYWFSHMEELGFPDIYQRSRQDLSQRCVYWLCTLLKYKLPPAKVIELGCGHGGLVGLMKWSGFKAMGSEMSPWVVSFAHEAFDIPMLLGKIEDQKFDFEKEEKFDAIILNDVLEHLPEPLQTMQYCASLLKEDGIFVIQMPCYPENRTYEDMVKNNDIFLEQMKADEHLHLFNRNSAQKLLKRIGFNFIEFEEPIFYFYDMYLIASKKDIVKNTAEKISNYLLSHPSGRLIQALIDKYQEGKTIQSQLQQTQSQLQQTQSQLQETQSQLQETQSQLQETQSQLQETQSQLQQTQSQLQETQSQLQQTQSQLQQTQDDAEKLRVEYQKLTQVAQNALIEINAMKSSKFWKMRSLWFKLKKVFGLSIN